MGRTNSCDPPQPHQTATLFGPPPPPPLFLSHRGSDYEEQQSADLHDDSAAQSELLSNQLLLSSSLSEALTTIWGLISLIGNINKSQPLRGVIISATLGGHPWRGPRKIETAVEGIRLRHSGGKQVAPSASCQYTRHLMESNVAKMAHCSILWFECLLL